MAGRERAIRLFLSLLVLATILAAAVSCAGWFYLENERVRPGPLSSETRFIVREGEGLSAIAERMEEARIIRNADMMKLSARLTGVETLVQAGEYQIPPGASQADVLRRLVDGQVVTFRITIPEGLTSAQIMRLIEADPQLSGPMPETPDEGALLPDTYVFNSGARRADLVDRMAAAQAELLDDLWPERADDLPFGARDEAVILASIVEKETGVPGERGEIAGVFVNRLRRGMRLESDPTIIYGVSRGEPLVNDKGQRRTLYRSEIDRETPWNTYQIDGLPPTPICNPGRDAIAAVLNPPETENIFFVADGTGGHAFAESYRDHQRNVAAYRRIEAERIAAERAQ